MHIQTSREPDCHRLVGLVDSKHSQMQPWQLFIYLLYMSKHNK